MLIDIDEQMIRLSIENKTGWMATGPLRKIHQFGVKLHTTNALYNAFCKLAGKSLHALNMTYWFSWMEEFTNTYKKRAVYNKIVEQYLE
jgi:hypothetical protein